MLVSEVGEESKQSEEDSWILIRRPRAESDCGVVNCVYDRCFEVELLFDFCFLLIRFSPVFWDMGHKVIEYVDTSQLYATNYVRNSKAIAVLWAIFTICYSIIVVVSFVTPGECTRRPFYLEQWLMWRPRAANCLLRMGRRLGIRDWRPHWPLESVREKWDERQLHRKYRRHDGLAVHAVAGEINEISSKHWLTEKLSIRLRRYLRALLWRRRC